jgi:[protein-PII] uridylyltransferase
MERFSVPRFDELPITELEEVRAFLRKLPLAVDAESFTRFVLGFPHKYLAATSPVEIVKHYALMGSLGGRAVISSISREGSLWRMCLVARDRSFLFARIAGCLGCFGMNIVAAEAFTNANALVLDTFSFADREGRFRDDRERRRFQAFLEDVVEGKEDLEAALRERTKIAQAPSPALSLEWDDDAHPAFTRLGVEGRDRLGLLYLISRHLSEAGSSIEMAFIETPGERVRDEFYLTEGGGKLSTETRSGISAALGRLAQAGG